MKSYEGRRFNSPNDLWVDAGDGVYFTDPRYGNRDDMELPGEYVFYLSPDQITSVLAYLNQQAESLDLKPFQIPKNRTFKKGDSVVAPVKDAGLFIELENYIKVPVQKGRVSDKGIATLRADPAVGGVLFVSDQMEN